MKLNLKSEDNYQELISEKKVRDTDSGFFFSVREEADILHLLK